MNKHYLITVSGLVGAGKTTVAKYLAKKLGAALFSTDEVRQQLIPKQKYLVFGKTRKKSYTRQEKNVVYNAISLATKHLLSYTDVVIDGTFDLNRYFLEARKIANRKKARFEIIECHVDIDVAKKRIDRRFKKKKDASKANWHIYKLVKKKYQGVKLPHLKLDTGQNWRKELNKWIKKL